MKIPSILFSVLLLVGMAAAASPENSHARAAFARLKAPLAPTCYAGYGATRKLSRHISALAVTANAVEQRYLHRRLRELGCKR